MSPTFLDILRSGRVHTAMATAAIPATACIALSGDPIAVGLVVIGATLHHAWGFSLNEIMDLDIDKKNPDLGDKLAKELPQIIFKALEVFAEEYMKDKGATIRNTPKASKAAFSQFRRSSQPIHQWVKDSLRPAEETDFSSSQDLYNSYTEWAKLNGHKTMSSSSFYPLLPKALGGKSVRAKREGSTERGYHGVKIKNHFV